MLWRIGLCDNYSGAVVAGGSRLFTGCLRRGQWGSAFDFFGLFQFLVVAVFVGAPMCV
jgi:hypothetical protein